MPPRSGQLDEISQAIGRLEGKVDEIDRYTHAREHGIANVSMKVDGLANKLSSDLAATEARINVSVTTAIERVEARIAAIDERVIVLERIGERETGARGVLIWLLQSPLMGWIVAAALFFAAWWKGVPHK